MTENFDHCFNSVTLDQEQRDFVNKRINDRLKLIGELFDKHDFKANLYVGGSVGLGQPSVAIENNITTLKSDLDMFLILPGLEKTASLQAFLKDITELPQDVDVSIHVQPVADFSHNPCSMEVDDLLQALPHPVRERFMMPELKSLKPQVPKTAVLYLCGRMGAAAAPFYVATHEFANVPGDVIAHDEVTNQKAALATLKFLFYGKKEGWLNISDVATAAREGWYEGIITEDEVIDIIRRREQYRPDQAKSNLDLAELFRKIVVKERGLEQSATTAEAFQSLRDRYLAEPDSVDASHSLLLAISLFLLAPSAALKDVVRRECAAELFSLVDLSEEWKSKLTEWANSDSSTADSIDSGRLMPDLVHAAMFSINKKVEAEIRNYYA